MFTGKGELITQSGSRIPLTVNMVGTDGPARMGRLSCNTSALEPKALLHPLKLQCEDGTSVDIAVTNYSDRHISFIGRLAA
jgi:hypothetical protein